MAETVQIVVILHSGVRVAFDEIAPGTAFDEKKDGVRVTVGETFPFPVTAVPPSIQDPIASIEYNLFTDIKNYHKVIIPESGRWYINMTQLVSFWRYNKESAVNDVKMPLYIFTGQDLNTALAFGVVGKGYETFFRALEPRVGRALIVYMRRLSMQIKRGTEEYPIPDAVAKANPDGSITEHVYLRTAAQAPNRPWLLTLRDFAECQKKIYDLPDVSCDASMSPLWCSWTDWFSDNVTEKVIVDNVREGVKLGIKNYIIDDGWFGPGLDNDFDVQLNIGDWRPDPAKITDMKKLVQDVKAEGGVPLIWCAPHAVAPGADCFGDRKKHLIRNAEGELLITSNKFHSLCFMDPEARRIMADICARFITEWDFDGAKYDLFNCVPNMRCCNQEHEHDVSSMVEGLELTLKQIDDACRAIKKDYVVELKQNYGTPFLSRYGTMTRAGDTPYNTEGNFLRTLYVAGYSPFSVNDYQTITNEDSPEEAACIVLKMIAAGIPSYSIDFYRLNQTNKSVIARYNEWYTQNIQNFKRYRTPLDGENNVIAIQGEQRDLIFLVNSGGAAPVARPTVIGNATFSTVLHLRLNDMEKARATSFDCMGALVETFTLEGAGWRTIGVKPGGLIEIGEM